MAAAAERARRFYRSAVSRWTPAEAARSMTMGRAVDGPMTLAYRLNAGRYGRRLMSTNRGLAFRHDMQPLVGAGHNVLWFVEEQAGAEVSEPPE